MAKKKPEGLSREERLARLEALHTDKLAGMAMRIRAGAKDRWAHRLATCKVTGRICIRYADTGELDLIAGEDWLEAERQAGG